MMKWLSTITQAGQGKIVVERMELGLLQADPVPADRVRADHDLDVGSAC